MATIGFVFGATATFSSPEPPPDYHQLRQRLQLNTLVFRPGPDTSTYPIDFGASTSPVLRRFWPALSTKPEYPAPFSGRPTGSGPSPPMPDPASFRITNFLRSIFADKQPPFYRVGALCRRCGRRGTESADRPTDSGSFAFGVRPPSVLSQYPHIQTPFSEYHRGQRRAEQPQSHWQLAQSGPSPSGYGAS